MLPFLKAQDCRQPSGLVPVGLIAPSLVKGCADDRGRFLRHILGQKTKRRRMQMI